SWQNTTCSCPSRAAGTLAVASWGYAGAVPPGLLAKTFVTVVTPGVVPRPRRRGPRVKRMPGGRGLARTQGRSAPARPAAPGWGAATSIRWPADAGLVMISLRVVPVSRDYCVPIFLRASLRGVLARLRAPVGVPRGRRPALGRLRGLAGPPSPRRGARRGAGR